MNSMTLGTRDLEGELLLRCCAVTGPFADSAQMLESIERGVDWNRFLSLGNRNCVTPMAAARLGVETAANVPRHVARALRLSYQANALRTNYLADCAAEVVDSFAAEGVAAIALKGPTLALAAYGDLGMRVFGDLDFMVRRSDLPRAATALERIGYSSQSYRADIVESGFFADLATDFSREGSVVDLHWQLSPSYFPFAPAAEQVWNRTVEVELRGRSVRVLGPADSVLFQAYHGSKHGWITLGQICDFARVLVTARPVSWPSVLDDARRIGSLRMLLLGADLAHSLSLCEVPAELIDEARRDPHVASLRSKVARDIFDSADEDELDRWRIAFGTIESTADRFRYIVERLVAPKMSDRALMPLPRALYPLYYLMRPVLVAIKHREWLRRSRRDAPALRS